MMFNSDEERIKFIRDLRDQHLRLADQYSHMRRIVCAAIRVGDEIICGPRHYDPTMVAQITARKDQLDWGEAEQGFVDNWGLFLSRDEAFEIAERQGQIMDKDIPERGLFSEHLY